MVVKTQSNGRQITGLYIGTRNARRHFSKDVKGIELHLGHLHIHCDLGPDFWKGRPEIRDTRLGDWLESRIFHGRMRRSPVPMVLVPAEKNSFRLHPLQLPSVSAHRGTEIAAAGAVARKSVVRGPVTREA